MKYEDIKVGDKVEFIAKSNMGSGVYTSSEITDVSTRYKIFTILSPKIDNKIMRFTNDQPFIFNFYFEGECYSCSCLFSRINKLDNMQYATFRVVSAFSKYERRKNVRYPLSIPIRYSIIDDDGGFVDPDTMLDGISVNISNGGMSFTNDRTLYPGDKLYLMLEKTSGIIATKGQVVHQTSVGISSVGEYPYKTSVRFTEKQNPRRKFDRYKCNFTVMYRVMDNSISDPSILHEGVLVDISRGGMRFCGNVALVKNTILTCEIKNPGAPLIAECSITSEQSRLVLDGGRFMFETSARFTKIIQKA